MDLSRSLAEPVSRSATAQMTPPHRAPAGSRAFLLTADPHCGSRYIDTCPDPQDDTAPPLAIGSHGCPTTAASRPSPSASNRSLRVGHADPEQSIRLPQPVA
jgi:hypothetical protein